MVRTTSWPLGFWALLASTTLAAQSTVGQLLDADAKRLSPEAFEQLVLQRPLVGPIAGGLNVELVYTPRGRIEGVSAGGPGVGNAAEWMVDVRGSWRFGDDGRVCSSLALDGPSIRANFPTSCQYWFRLGDRYFVAESASDRNARALPRRVRE